MAKIQRGRHSMEAGADGASKMDFFYRDFEHVASLPSGSFCGCYGLSLWVEKGKWISLEWLIMNLRSLFL